MTASIAHAAWLRRPELAAVFDAVERGGDEVRVVGGAVRNTLMGLPVADVDLATTALPEAVVARAKAAGLKPVPTGIDHGTVTVVSGRTPYEVTTLRADVETDGRRAVVHFGRDWKIDAERRDFTMNALYADREGRVHDPVGGRNDCLARRVRFIGDPERRIREDYLRILRFFRFQAAYGTGEADAAALAAAIHLRDGLRTLSHERIGQEMRRLVAAPRGGEVAGLMQDAGILGIVLAGIGRPIVLQRLGPTGPALALAALAAFAEDDAERLADRLRLSNAERRTIEVAVLLARRFGASPSAAMVRAAVYDAGNAAAVDALRLASAVEGVAAADERLQLARDWPAPKLPVTAAMLMEAGLKPGPSLGAALRRAEEAWVASDFTLEAPALLGVAIDA